MGVEAAYAEALVALLAVHEAVADERLHLRETPLLEELSGYEAGERLVAVVVPVRLPPVLVVLRDDVQNVALGERQADLLARYEHVLLRHVVVQGAQVQYVVGVGGRGARLLLPFGLVSGVRLAATAAAAAASRLVVHVRYDKEAHHAL